MSGASRKAKLSKYVVTLRREVEYVAHLDVEARSLEEAVDIANNVVDNSSGGYWVEGDVTSHTAKAKVVR